MNAEKIQELENRLEKALESMDVPEHRKNIKTIHNYKWLHKNLRTKTEIMKSIQRLWEYLKCLL